MNFTRKGNRRLVAPTTNLRASIVRRNLSNTEMAQYNAINAKVASQGLAPTEIPRFLNGAKNMNSNTKKKLMHYWVRQYTGIVSPNRIENALRQVQANRKTHRLRR
jgi:hypothetical protein